MQRVEKRRRIDRRYVKAGREGRTGSDDKFTKQIDEITDHKKKEIMEI